MGYFFAMIENYRNYLDGLYCEMYLFLINLMHHSIECISSIDFTVILEDYYWQQTIFERVIHFLEYRHQQKKLIQS